MIQLESYIEGERRESCKVCKVMVGGEIGQLIYVFEQHVSRRMEEEEEQQKVGRGDGK